MNITFSQQKHSVRSSDNEYVVNLVNGVLEALPNEFDLKIVKTKYLPSNVDSLHLILQQEAKQYNQLLNCIRTTSTQLLDAFQGDNMSIYTICF